MLDEKFLSYLWFNRLCYETQTTLLGQKVKIISPGMINTNEGPDAFNAKIEIDGILWIGNVEFHVKASDWHRHNHDSNPHYDNVILHIVLDGDEQIFNSADRMIPTVSLQYPEHLLTRHTYLEINKMGCSSKLEYLEDSMLHNWIDRLLIERIEYKTKAIKDILSSRNNNFEETFYIFLSRSMGFGVNSDSMQNLAENIPLTLLMHHRDNLLQLEALMLGMAGLLPSSDNTVHDKRTKLWLREFDFMRNKFSLTPVITPPFKMARMRPQGFPTVRIAQFAAIIHNTDNLFSRVIKAQNIKELYDILCVKADGYWETHYRPDHVSDLHNTELSKASADILIINAIVPFRFLWAQQNGDELAVESALELLKRLKPEKNFITGLFASYGIKSENAYDSQALIQLYRYYCEPRNCLRCRIGHALMTRKD